MLKIIFKINKYIFIKKHYKKTTIIKFHIDTSL